MLRLFADAKYDFIGARRRAYAITAVFLVVGLAALILNGVNYSVEFTGGTLVQVHTQAPIDVGVVRSELAAHGINGAEIQSFGSPTEYVIRARTAKEGTDADNTQETATAISEGLDQVLGVGAYTISRTEAVGPKVGGELRQKAFIAILLSFLAVLLYLAFRFEWRFGLAAVIATAHDLMTTIGFVALLNLEISLVVVAAILSMVGYSLNDTIIIFDRVRENLRKIRGEDLSQILNRSINETLPRSVLTHGTTLATLGALAIFGGEVIRPFALVMFFGVLTGTFSSIYIASPILRVIEARWPGEGVKALSAPIKGRGSASAKRKVPSAT
jgi:preprotein translocase subunit SecF